MEMTATKPTFQKYAAYKDSGVEWLGEIPKHWELARLGSYFEERKTKVSDKDYRPLSVTKQGILPQLDSAAKSNDGDNRKLVKKGDFVINSRSDRKGSSGIANEDGSVSLINIVMKPTSIHPTFCNYLLKSNAFVEENYRIGHGIVADLWTTRYDEMKNIKIGVPSLEEQTAIANFLDDKTGKIDRAIAQKEKMIALLKERKQIIIQNAVTKGLDPNAKMKDSGVEWIGEIPEGWEVKKIKYLVTKISNGTTAEQLQYPDENDSSIVRVTRIETISQEEINLSKVGWVKKTNLLTGFKLKKGDILFSHINSLEMVGKTALFNGEADLYSGMNLLRISPKQNINYYWLHLYLKSKISRNYFTSMAKPSINQASLPSTVILNYNVAYPPIEEQSAIVAHIETQSAKIDKTISLQERQIEKLKELKSTLIDSAVSGKIKVS
jgi:type I restriction enzyme S subunit